MIRRYESFIKEARMVRRPYRASSTPTRINTMYLSSEDRIAQIEAQMNYQLAIIDAEKAHYERERKKYINDEDMIIIKDIMVDFAEEYNLLYNKDFDRRNIDRCNPCLGICKNSDRYNLDYNPYGSYGSRSVNVYMKFPKNIPAFSSFMRFRLGSYFFNRSKFDSDMKSLKYRFESIDFDMCYVERDDYIKMTITKIVTD